MKMLILGTVILSTFILSSLTFANNPNNGYCQTVDTSACGWGSKSALPLRPIYVIAVAFDEDTDQ